jgi:hypothetical protein
MCLTGAIIREARRGLDRQVVTNARASICLSKEVLMSAKPSRTILETICLMLEIDVYQCIAGLKLAWACDANSNSCDSS